MAAAYFPTTEPPFRQIETKFLADYKGVSKNGASGFAFFVNQSLTIGERQALLTQVGQSQAEIYHLERIRGILDAPKGCGVRLEYLRIPMTEEEQWAFWSSMNQDVVRRLVDHEQRRDAQYQTLDEKLDQVLARTIAIGYALTEQRSHLQRAHTESVEMPTLSLSLGTVCWLHRVITEGDKLPEATRGRLRSVQVWIGASESTADTATFLPVPPEEVVGRLQTLFSWWQEQHAELVGAPRDKVIAGLAEFHHSFLKIHPFLDANGRLARLLLDQAARELLNQSITSEFTGDPIAYYAALREADSGNLHELISRISAALK
ncbi:Fic family protein [Cyanobium gracile UHCC 0139]|uniref:Fic family protein n=1 Tax=Cyanobium gracile UHCC 0139 TaxID=3110308 RepID=A0ABU5RT03_9CYAN|nr:Fic family protein [Cyanobium gracile]MEA5390901.1 Fic family protein [Cyanobium gracile UHCC 0139]